MKKKIQIRLATESDLPSLLDLVKKISEEADSQNKNIFEEKYWAWQYKNNSNEGARVYLALDGNELVGYYHAPLYRFNALGEVVIAAHVQSVAIARNYRKFGVFQALSEFATNDLNKISTISYSFPNNKSIHTFCKYNSYVELARMPAYILPIDLGPFLEGRIGKLLANGASFLSSIWVKLNTRELGDNVSIRIKEQFTNQDFDLIYEFSKKYKISLLRDAKYLEWRYFGRPGSEYFVIELVEHANVVALVVASWQNIFGTMGLVIMDLSYRSEKGMKLLLSNIANHMIYKGYPSPCFIFFSGIIKSYSIFYNCGFIRVPSFLNPRILRLVFKGSKNYKKEMFSRKNWLVTLGDWDVF